MITSKFNAGITVELTSLNKQNCGQWDFYYIFKKLVSDSWFVKNLKIKYNEQQTTNNQDSLSRQETSYLRISVNLANGEPQQISELQELEDMLKKTGSIA